MLDLKKIKIRSARSSRCMLYNLPLMPLFMHLYSCMITCDFLSASKRGLCRWMYKGIFVL